MDRYLDRKPGEILNIPQIVIIDRKGMIRQRAEVLGRSPLEDETTLRAMIEELPK